MPFKLYYKIYNYLVKEAYKLQNNKNIEMRMLVNSLPDKIRNDLLKIIYKDVIKNFKIFRDNRNSDFILKMLTCFIQTTCQKDTILMLEGKIVDNIIFVKDGRLILEATIDLKNPLKSIKKYFKENFMDLDNNNNNAILGGKDDKEKGENENNIFILKKRLNSFFENNNKDINDKSSMFRINTYKMNESFQIGLNENFLENEEKSIIEKEETNCQYLKILDIRKNENFGDIYMFLERPSPLTLKVKSKFAEIYLLKKKDAININNIHHNIMNRIKTKSFKNLLNIRKKTIKILTKFFDYNKFINSKGKTLQDMSWFTEKSKIFTDRTNLTIPSTLRKPKENLSLFAKKRNKFKNSCIVSRLTREITKLNSENIKKCISTNSSRKGNNKTILNNLRNSSRFKNKTNNDISINQKSSNNSNSINNTNTALKSLEFLNNSFNNNNISNEFNKENSNFSKTKKNSPNNINSLDITNKENEIITLNNFNSKLYKNIRKKIKLGVKKEKIINLWKFQNEIINFRIDNQKTNIYTYADENDINLLNNNADNYKDINNILFNLLLKYLESEK